MTFEGEHAVYVQPDFFSDARFVGALFASYRYSALATPGQSRAIIEAVRHGEIDRVVISNPYRDPIVNGLYVALRNAGLPLLIVERGALPGSVFLDVGGFLGDSRTYDPEHWQVPLTATEAARLEAYRRRLATTDEPLERQARRAGRELIRTRLLNGRNKLCVVTLQMSSDAVTNHFIRPGLDYPSFKALIGEAIPKLEGEWSFAVKAHPREPLASIGGRPTCNDVNISDLIEASDAFVTFNSGTGVTAMLSGRPVGCFGDAFYGAPGLVANLAGIDDLAAFLAAPDRSHDPGARDRFLHHLVFRLYSEVRFLAPFPFGAMTRPVAMQGRVIRVYDPETRASFELDRTRTTWIGDVLDREIERLRAWRRAAVNRVAARA